MNTLLSSPPELQLPSVAFFGRTLDEYARFFSLDRSRLAGRRVLDVAAGPSSFTAEASALGAEAVAADPLYGCPAASLAAYVELDYRRMLEQMRRHPGLLRFGYFPSIEAAEASRRAAAARFLADYEAGFAQGRYVGARLPRLPFADGAFDLVLCAHLLFTYARLFDYAFHLAACLELMRVGRGEARLHPLSGLDGRTYPELPRLQEDLRAAGIEAQAVAVDYEFFAGTGRMLVLRR
ncbi:MAG TPA: methyltransferase [Opitutaceae bacterium]|nr:methyltransferase [Opitutaceae bacterium]